MSLWTQFLDAAADTASKLINAVLTTPTPGSVVLRDDDGNLFVLGILSPDGQDIRLIPGFIDATHTGRRLVLIHFGKIQSTGPSAGKTTSVVFQHAEKGTFMDWQLFGTPGTPDTDLVLVQGFQNLLQVVERFTASISARVWDVLGATALYFDLTGAGSSFNIRFAGGAPSAFKVDSTGKIGLNNSAPVAKGEIIGSRANPEQALKNLLDYLASRGDFTNSTTA